MVQWLRPHFYFCLLWGWLSLVLTVIFGFTVTFLLISYSVTNLMFLLSFRFMFCILPQVLHVKLDYFGFACCRHKYSSGDAKN